MHPVPETQAYAAVPWNPWSAAPEQASACPFFMRRLCLVLLRRSTFCEPFVNVTTICF